MKNILCFGDSNTWGFNPETQKRFALYERWPGVAQQILDSDPTGYRIIEEGLNGRTTVWQDPIEGYKSGLDYIVPCIETHKPLDLVVIMLGTNDIKKRFSLSAFDIARGASRLAEIVMKSNCGPEDHAPQVLLVSPTTIGDLSRSRFGEMFDYDNGTETSGRLAPHYREFAALLGCHYLDAAAIASPSPADALHFDLAGQKQIGQAMAVEIQRIVG